ncbi:MAG: DUF3849 domain-containing protein [Oscillospiraceae bacterium]|nr:DUF3849 domain-containing protein [Oscillospiraceae bacterium]
MGIMEVVKDGDWKSVPIYRESGTYAREHGEIEKYRESNRASNICKQAVEETIRKNFDGMRLTAGCEKPVIEMFGPDRVEYVLAVTLQQKSWDGRFGKDNLEWAKSIPVKPDISALGNDRNMWLVVDSHPAVLDGFVRHARKSIEEVRNPTLKQQLEKAKSMVKAPEVKDIGKRSQEVR